MFGTGSLARVLVVCMVAGASLVQADSGEVATRMLDDLEAGIKHWSPDADNKKFARVERETELVHTGKGAVRLTFTAGSGEKKYAFFSRSFVPLLDLSAYSCIEFWIRYDGPKPLVPKYFEYTVVGGYPRRWMSVTKMEHGKWQRFRYPIAYLKQPAKTKLLRFAFKRGNYPSGKDISFIVDDVRAVKDPSWEARYSPKVRKKISMFPWKPVESRPEPTTLVLYPVLPFEFILPDMDLSKRPVLTELRTSVCRGERKPLTFAVSAARRVRNLRITASDLKARGGAEIPASAIDIRVVKVWPQSSRSSWHAPEDGPDYLVPELLVYDDSLEFEDGFVDRDGFMKVYQAPPPIHGPLRTDIPAKTVKQFWLTVAVGKDVTPGTYRGKLSLRADGFPCRSLPLIVEVLPWVLPPPCKLYGTFYHAYEPTADPACKNSGPPKARAKLLAELRTLKEAGLECISINPGALSETKGPGIEYDDFFKILHDVGMKGPFFTFRRERIEEKIEAARRYGYDIYFYGYDEPNNAERMKRHVQLARKIAAHGGKVVVAITVEAARALKDPKGYPYRLSPGPCVPLDWAILSPGASYLEYVRRYAAGRTGRVAPLQTIYWQYYIENPTKNRVLAGFHIWASGMDGATPYIYQSFPGMSPYNSGDRRVAHFRSGAKSIFRAWCVAYPTQRDPIPTLQWEGFRAGIDDVRYLTLLSAKIEEAREAGRVEAAEAAERQMRKIVAPFLELPPRAPDGYILDKDLGLYVEPYMLVKAREEIVRLIRALAAE